MTFKKEGLFWFIHAKPNTIFSNKMTLHWDRIIQQRYYTRKCVRNSKNDPDLKSWYSLGSDLWSNVNCLLECFLFPLPITRIKLHRPKKTQIFLKRLTKSKNNCKNESWFMELNNMTTENQCLLKSIAQKVPRYCVSSNVLVSSSWLC